MYYWLRRHDYPEGFQVLCAKHNMSKGTMTTAEYEKFIEATYAVIKSKASIV